MPAVKLKCFNCNTELEFVDRVGRKDECDSCGADAHCCKNCKFYDPKVYNECKETSAEVVREKDRANFCDYFEAGSAEGGSSDKQKLLDAAEALFKK